MSFRAVSIGLLVIALAAAYGIRSRPIPESSAYRGSPSCQSCHPEIFAAWSASQHTKMMRPVSAPGVVVADFSTDDPDRRFEREDAVWAIGGKWEQQFMGHDGEGETLLAGAWLHLAGKWQFKGWDGWELPVPSRRCHGCHTVGLDLERGTFVEANIGCESCHGPAGWHVETWGLGRVHASADAQLCGQCHSRGTSPSGEYFFPVGYRPGKDLSAFFVHESPTLGQNSSHWWGNGRPRQRHQEFTAWQSGGHAMSLERLRTGYDGRHGEVTGDCLRCHSGDIFLGHTPPELDAAQWGVTCTVCHNVHGNLTELRVGCDDCHVEGAFYHRPERNEAHVPCPPEASVDCVGCHMPRSVSIGGAFALHDHAPGPIPPHHTPIWGTPSSCANGGCHADADPAQLDAIFRSFYRAEE